MHACMHDGVSFSLGFLLPGVLGCFFLESLTDFKSSAVVHACMSRFLACCVRKRIILRTNNLALAALGVKMDPERRRHAFGSMLYNIAYIMHVISAGWSFVASVHAYTSKS